MSEAERYPTGEPVNFSRLPLDFGIIHYASDTPFTQARTLGARGLSYFGMDSTYAASVAILRRILEREGALGRPPAAPPRRSRRPPRPASCPRRRETRPARLGDSMPLLSVSQLAVAYGAETIFSGLDLRLERRARLAVVGANGAGKSSLLRVLAGELEPSEGRSTASAGCAAPTCPRTRPSRWPTPSSRR